MSMVSLMKEQEIVVATAAMNLKNDVMVKIMTVTGQLMREAIIYVQTVLCAHLVSVDLHVVAEWLPSMPALKAIFAKKIPV